MSGWADSDRRSRLPDNWPKLRAERLKLDGHRCTWILPSKKRCPRPATDVDHRRAMEDDHRIQALQSLCAHHHAKKSAMEGFQARRKKAASRFNPPEEHPGRLR